MTEQRPLGYAVRSHQTEFITRLTGLGDKAGDRCQGWDENEVTGGQLKGSVCPDSADVELALRKNLISGKIYERMEKWSNKGDIFANYCWRDQSGDVSLGKLDTLWRHIWTNRFSAALLRHRGCFFGFFILIFTFFFFLASSISVWLWK